MKKIIIIGAGISGLSAGIYARRSGFDVTIYESNTIPGGASTSWRRKGYLFEGGMHWLTGSSPQTPLYRLWREVGALDDSVTVFNRDPFFCCEYQGKSAYLYRDIEKLRQHFFEVSPEDKAEINRLCRDIKRFTKMTMPVTDIKGVKVKYKSKMPISSLFSMLPAIPRMPFYAKQTVGEYAARFQSPLLRELLQNITGAEYNATALVFTLATLASGDGGYPEGGSLAMAKRIAKRFTDLGGEIQYGKTVGKVAVENGVARGVVIDGEEIPADAVIVTRDTLSAIDTLFDTPIMEPWAVTMRENVVPMLDTFVSIGVEADLSELPESLVYIPEETFSCGNIPVSVIEFNNYARFKDYAPEGCTALTTFVVGDSYDYWQKCREDGTYEREKQKLAESFIKELSQRFPQIEGKIALWDVATPLTYEHYLGSYKGSWMSVMGKDMKNRNYPTKPETIGNLYFAGQRLMSPGGLPVALETGRKAVQYLCRDTDMVFESEV